MAHHLTAGLLKAAIHHPRLLLFGISIALAVTLRAVLPLSAPAVETGQLPPSIQAYFQQVAKRIEEQGGRLAEVAYLGSFKASDDEDWSWFAATIESGQGKQIVSLVITLDRSGTIVRVE